MMNPMPKPRPPHLQREQTRHGQVTWYVRRGKGSRIRLKALYGSEEFWKEYRSALEGARGSEPVKAHTLSWGLDRYRNSSAWASLSNATRRQRENIYRATIQTAGETPLKHIKTASIRAGRERRAAAPHAANNFLKAMRGFFGWAVEVGLVRTDPTKGVKLLTGSNDAYGFHTWSQEELDRFEARWPLGTRQRLAFDLLLYTGLRRGMLSAWVGNTFVVVQSSFGQRSTERERPASRSRFRSSNRSLNRWLPAQQVI
jgi:site-specific recombinase XerC